MGIRNLDKIITSISSKKAIYDSSFRSLSKKIIVIDTSIYLYNFTESESLIESFEKLLNIFKKYKIIPFFVFDGKPPKEKLKLLKHRQQIRNNAIKQLAQIEAKGVYNIDQVEELKKLSVKVSKEDIQKVQQLFQSRNISFIVAPGESDILCAYLVHSGKAWGVMSNDMDFFVYGLNYILKIVDLDKEIVKIFNTKQILKEFKINQEEFREIIVLSGTDYNTNYELDLREIWRQFYIYKSGNFQETFYVWLTNNKIMKVNFDKILPILQSFHVYKNPFFIENKKMFENIKITNPW